MSVLLPAIAVSVAVLFGAQPSDQTDALSEAARKGDAAAVSRLLDGGIDVNTKFRGQVIMATPAISSGSIIVRGLKDVIAIGHKR